MSDLNSETTSARVEVCKQLILLNIRIQDMTMKTASCKLKISEGIGRLLIHLAPEHEPTIHSYNYMDLAKPHHSMLGLTTALLPASLKVKCIDVLQHRQKADKFSFHTALIPLAVV